MTKIVHMSAAKDAAHALAACTEWESAGYMLRVSVVEEPHVALHFARDARAECLNEEGRTICTQVIDIINREMEMMGKGKAQ